MSNGKITAKELIDDIRKGLDDSALIEKYKVSSQALQGFFKQLKEKGLIKQEELEQRAQIFKCPACNWSSNKKFEECPHCGIIVAKFRPKKSLESKQPAQISSATQPDPVKPDQTGLTESTKLAPIISEQTSSTSQQYKNCPYCGEQILSIAKKCKHCGEFLNHVPQSAQLQEKSVTQKSIVQETVLWEGYPSHLYYLVDYIIGGLLILSVFGIVIGLIVIGYAILAQRSKRFTITSQRVTSTEGIFSRNVHEVVIKDIRNINFKQNIIERLVGLGSIEVGTAGTAGIEVRFAGIPESQKVKDMISKLKDQFV